MFELFLAEFKRSWIQFIRYPTEAIAGIVITTIFFYGLFLSAQYIASPGTTAGNLPAAAFGERIDIIVVGYILWTLVLFIVGNISSTLQSEAQTGTLEQLFLSQFGATTVFLVRAIASLALQFILISVALGIILLLTGSRLAFPIMLVLPLFTVILGAYGIAFIMGSLALRLKQIQQVSGILQFPILFLLTVPIESWSGNARFLGWLLPMMPGAGLLRDVMAREQPLNFSLWAIALLNSAVYFTLGTVLFRWAERETKRKGRLSGY
jgi:ABC-2 type transport system permease protein